MSSRSRARPWFVKPRGLTVADVVGAWMETDRTNLAICDRFLAGDTLGEIMHDFNLSYVAVLQIITDEFRRVKKELARLDSFADDEWGNI